MKRNVVISTIFLLISFAFSACAPVPSDQRPENPNIAANDSSTEILGDSSTRTPEFFSDIGKTLSELKNEILKPNLL